MSQSHKLRSFHELVVQSLVIVITIIYLVGYSLIVNKVTGRL